MTTQLAPCEHCDHGACRIASALINAAAATSPEACSACDAEAEPRAINRVTVGLAIAAVKREGKNPANLVRQFAGILQVRRPFPLRVVSYAAAVARWLREGRPVRSPEEVERLYYQVCGTCPLREATSQPEVSYCGACGCVLSPDPSVANKLFFASEGCPGPEKRF